MTTSQPNRIWAADLINDKYQGFGGRFRYCLSFYGLVDFLATYPVWLGIAFPALIPENRPDINAFVLRPSSDIINFNARKLCIAYRMALIISEMLDPGHGIRPEDVAEMKKRGEGYVVEENKEKKEIMKNTNELI